MKSEKKNKKISPKVSLLAAGIVFLFVLLALCCFSVLGIVAFKTNNYIPGITEIVEGIEQSLVDPKDKARQWQLKLVEDLDVILNKMSDEEGITYEQLEDKYNELYSDEYDYPGKTNYTFSYDIFYENDEDSVFLLKLDGENQANQEANTTSGILNFDLEFSGIKTDGKIEYVTDFSENNQDYYIKLVEMPLLNIIGKTDEYDFTDNWMQLSGETLQELQSELNRRYYYLTNRTNLDKQTIKLEKNKSEMIKRTLESEELLGKVSWEKGKTFNGARARCLSFSWRDKQIEQFTEKLEDITESDITTRDLENTKENFEQMKVTICTDRQTGQVYEIDFLLDLKSEEEMFGNNAYDEDMKIQLRANFVMSDHEEEKEIKVPDAEIDLGEILKSYYETLPDPDSNVSSDNHNNFPNDEFYIDHEYDPDRLYTLYTSNNCPNCEKVEVFIIENYLKTKANIVSYYIDESNHNAEMFNYICNLKKETCSVPLLVIYDYSSGAYESEVIEGSTKITQYFEKEYLEKD